jgi:acyl-CoA dehydrogenase
MRTPAAPSTSGRTLLYSAQEQLHSVLRNFPNRPIAALIRAFVFPRGLTYFAPSDRLGHAVGELAMTPGPTRTQLARHIYARPEPDNPVGQLQQALEMAVTAEPLERKVRIEGVKPGRIGALDPAAQIDEALALGILSAEEARLLRDYDARVMELINVDDFAPDEL